MTRAIVRVLLSMILAFSVSGLLADRVYLRNGQQLDGAIVNQNKSEITFRAESGQVQEIQKSDLVRIVYGNLTPEQKAIEAKQKQEAALAASQRRPGVSFIPAESGLRARGAFQDLFAGR